MAAVVASVAGQFGAFLHGRLGPDGPVVVVALPAPGLRVTAHWSPAGPFRLHAPGRTVSPGSLLRLWRALGGQAPRGLMRIVADMPAGGGAGASTATLLAAATVFTRGALPEPDRLAALCRAIDGTCDPLMHPHPDRLLWAPRAGHALQALPPPPTFEVVGAFLGGVGRSRPEDRRFADVSDLVAAWQTAAGDAGRLAALATEAALRNHALRGGPPLAPLTAIAAEHGAAGIVTAPSGSARGLLFVPGTGDPTAAASALRALGAAPVVRFRT